MRKLNKFLDWLFMSDDMYNKFYSKEENQPSFKCCEELKKE